MASNQKKVAIVTGANKGIGFHIVKGLCQKFDGVVYLTARNAENGKKALEELDKLGLHPKFYQLDISDNDQIKNFAKYIQENYGGVDILVNNAAVLYSRKDNYPVEKFVNEVVFTNFTSIVNMWNAFFPLFKSNARVVNISSRLGLLSSNIKNNELKKKFTDPNLTLDGLIKLMDEYMEACKNGTDEKDGYATGDMSSYGMSKLALNVLTRIQQKLIDSDTSRHGIVVSALCPGYCKTDMARGGGFLTAEQGAHTPLFLSLLPENFDGPKGSFWAEESPIDWETGGIITSSLPMIKKYVFSFFKGSK